MWEHFLDFCKLLWVKSHPSDYEKSLFEKTQKYCRYISWIPGLKMVGVCGSLSMHATKTPEETKKIKWTDWSDIDLFIITANKRMWFVRIAVTIIFQILWVRRHWDKVKERFCLSFFITENAMDFSKIAIENDIYLFYWIYYLKPIINKDNTYERFIKANENLGINSINLHWDNKIYLVKPIFVISSKVEKSINFILNPLLDLKNWMLKKIFLSKTLKHKKRLWDPFWLIVNDNMLKFTDNDRRVEIRDELSR